MKQSKIWKFFSSLKLAIWLLAVIAVLSLIGTLIPQNQEPAFYLEKYGQAGYGFLSGTGLSNIYGSWWFISFLILLSLNLAACIINRFSIKNFSWGTLICHISVMVILIGALIGMIWGEKGFIRISKNEEFNSFSIGNKKIDLGFSIRLNEFVYTENVNPKEKLFVCPKQEGDFCKMQPSVHASGAANEAAGESKKEEILAEVSTEIGKVSQIGDTGYKVKILRYLPDFVMDTATKVAVSRSSTPNNPALELELTDKEGKTKTFWVFARFPEMHQEPEFKFVYNWAMRTPKDFISKVTILKDGKEVLNKDIRVNDPLHFGGYTFFQSSYDSEELSWSGLQVVKDPGVPVIYLGFIMLIFGLIIIFYINPFHPGHRRP